MDYLKNDKCIILYKYWKNEFNSQNSTFYDKTVGTTSSYSCIAI